VCRGVFGGYHARVPSSERSSFSSGFLFFLIASGWGAAIWLGLQLREEEEIPAPAPAPAVVTKTHSQSEQIGHIFREWGAEPNLKGAAIGFCLLGEKGEVIYASPLAETALCPASSLKTVTTGAALGLLGLDFRFETQLNGTAEVGKDGTLDGDLVLIGGGDPTFETEDLEKLAETVVAAGLKKVTGQVRVDASIFPRDAVSDHWNWGDIGNAYGAGVYGLNLDHNRLTVRFEAGSVAGAPAKFLDGGPAPKETQWNSFVSTGPADSGDQVVIYSEPYGRRITLRGTVPAGESDFSVRGANPDPLALAAETLRARLETAGVQFGGGTAAAEAEAKVNLAKHQSAPLPEIIDHLHRVSDNLEAQALFFMIGRNQKKDPPDAICSFWEKAGVDFAAFRYVDGSGLARANMIRPIDLAKVNYVSRHQNFGPRFFDSLSTYEKGTVRAKIGGMSGVLTQVGFLRTEAGHEWTFAIMANGLGEDADFWSLKSQLFEKVRGLDR